jgi:hypothetical protein
MGKIIAKDFITDDKTNKVYISSLIDTISGDLDIQTRCELKACIEAHCPNLELLKDTKDVWARDYMPIQLTKDVFLGYTYDPDYLVEEDQKYITDWQLHNVHTPKDSFKDLPYVQIPLILDGGNVVKAVLDGKPYMIMCDKVLTENNYNRNNKTEVENFKKWWDQWWKEKFDGTEMGLVLLPWEGKEFNPIGHADGMVRYIGNGHVLMTNYLDFDKKYKDDQVDEDSFGKKLWTALFEAGFDVVTLDFWNEFADDYTFQLLFDESWCYINYLQVDNTILVPSLGYSKLDKAARRQIKAAFKKANQQVDVQTIECNMTPIVKDMNDKMNSGGALNCLTWTIQSDK